HRVEPRDEDDEWRMQRAPRRAEYSGDGGALEGGFDPPTGRVEAWHRFRVRRHRSLAKLVVQAAVLEPEELAQVVAPSGPLIRLGRRDKVARAFRFVGDRAMLDEAERSGHLVKIGRAHV